jgi:hypothetical protein
MCRSHRYRAESDAFRPTGAELERSAVDRGPAPAGRPTWERSGADRTIRAADRDREAVIALLGEHTGAGRLTLAEFEDRVAGATAARTLADLDRLLVDLPVASAPRPTAPSYRRIERWRPWLITAAICLTIWAATSIVAEGVIYFWPFWVIVPWGIMLATGGGWSSSRRRRLVR